MGAVYATVADIRASGYPLTAAQETTATTLLEQSSAQLRIKAREFDKEIDAMIADPVTGEDYALAVKSVVIQATCRGLDSAQNQGGSGISQGSQTLGAYSVQQTFFNPGRSLYFLNNELKDLGLYYSQTCTAVEIYATEDDDVYE